jgi:dinuclear metal center YbgI/SA1388 family protein
MTTLHSICTFLDALLTPHLYADIALNGLQVEASDTPESQKIKKVAVAVDAGLSVIKQAIKEEAGLLVVHHGIFWGGTPAVSGIHGKKINSLIRNNLSLYASHLPLDGNDEVGNAAELARFLELKNLSGFCEYKGQDVGVQGTCDGKRTLQDFAEKLSEMTGAVKPVVLPFGPDKIQSVAVVPGSGSQAIELCSSIGYCHTPSAGAVRRDSIDLLISGEPKQEAYHAAKEFGVNAIFAGHYATETFGVRSLAKKLESAFDVQTVFIDEPTGI